MLLCFYNEKKLLVIFVFISTMILTIIARGDQPLIQDFLKREVYLQQGSQGVLAANSYRMVHYTGIRGTKFMGKHLMLHEKVHGSLRCVEKQIKQDCQGIDYEPEYMSSWRANNTFEGGEISNHVFGIAIDIDPHINTCCGCVEDWAKAEGCKNAPTPKAGSVPLGTHSIPKCWIKSFEDNGWYWLGNEPTLRDTMHFEFLAKPGTVTCD